MVPDAHPISRRSERIRGIFPMPLRLKPGGEDCEHLGFTVNISQDGIRIRTRLGLTAGQALDVVAGGAGRLQANCRVVWVCPTGYEQAWEAGLEFLN